MRDWERERERLGFYTSAKVRADVLGAAEKAVAEGIWDGGAALSAFVWTQCGTPGVAFDRAPIVAISIAFLWIDWGISWCCHFKHDCNQHHQHNHNFPNPTSLHSLNFLSSSLPVFSLLCYFKNGGSPIFIGFELISECPSYKT